MAPHFLISFLLLATVSAQGPAEVTSSSKTMAQLKIKLDKTEKLIKIQHKVTEKFLTYSPMTVETSAKILNGSFMDVQLTEEDKLRKFDQTWNLRETLGFPYTKFDSFTRLYSLRPLTASSTKSESQPRKNIHEFSMSLWKIDFAGEGQAERPLYRLKNTFNQQECLTAVAVQGKYQQLQLKACPEDGARGADETIDDASLFYLRFL